MRRNGLAFGSARFAEGGLRPPANIGPGIAALALGPPSKASSQVN